MKIHLQYEAFLFSIILIYSINCDRSSAQSNFPDRRGSASGTIISLDGEWLLVTDPQNIGKNEKWWEAPVPGAKPIKVPWILQDVYPGYHGVVWYWRYFFAPKNNYLHGRTLLTFLVN